MALSKEQWLAVGPMLLGLLAQGAPAQTPVPRDSSTFKLQIYGFAQADAIVDFKTNNPDWYDVNRPSRLPSFTDEFGHDGHTYLSVRQSRFGTKAWIPMTKGPD